MQYLKDDVEHEGGGESDDGEDEASVVLHPADELPLQLGLVHHV